MTALGWLGRTMGWEQALQGPWLSRALAELETSILQHCCRISQYLGFNSVACTQGSCDKGFTMEHVRYLQSASRCDIEPKIDRLMEMSNNSVKYQVPLRSCVWASGKSS